MDLSISLNKTGPVEA